MESFFKNNMDKDMTVEDLEREIRDVPANMDPKFAVLFGEITKEELLKAINMTSTNEDKKAINHISQNDDKTVILGTLVQNRLKKFMFQFTDEASFMVSVGVVAHRLPINKAVEILEHQYFSPLDKYRELYYCSPELMLKGKKEIDPVKLYTYDKSEAYKPDKEDILNDVKKQLKKTIRMIRVDKRIDPINFGPIKDKEIIPAIQSLSKSLTSLEVEVFQTYVFKKKWNSPEKLSKGLAKEMNSEILRQNKAAKKQWKKESKEQIKENLTGGWER